MATEQKSPSCVTCHQPLPGGKEPEYFAQGSVGYRAETEAERATEDVDQCLRYAQTVNSVVWDMLQVADANSRELCDKEHYLESARSLCFLLTDLVDEVTRRAETLSKLIADKVKSEKAQQPNGARDAGKEG